MGRLHTQGPGHTGIRKEPTEARDAYAAVNHSLASVIGSLAAAASISSFVPQILKIIRTRDASSVSVRMYLLTITAFSLWASYGGLIGSLPVMASNIAALILSSITLYLKWHFRERRGQLRRQK